MHFLLLPLYQGSVRISGFFFFLTRNDVFVNEKEHKLLKSIKLFQVKDRKRKKKHNKLQRINKSSSIVENEIRRVGEKNISKRTGVITQERKVNFILPFEIQKVSLLKAASRP